MTNFKISSAASTLLSATASIAIISLTTYYINKTRKKNNNSANNENENYVVTSIKTTPPEELLSDDGMYNEELKLAYKLAIQAGNNIYEHVNTKGTIAKNKNKMSMNIETTKSNETDFATNIDILNEKLIISQIKKIFPTHDIIDEESTGSGPVTKLSNDTPTWIIDPIDGTTNFASGFPLCCVSIGFCDTNGIPTLGVVYCPNTNEIYSAIRGRGAFRNNIPISLSTEETNKKLSNSIVCFELGYTKQEKHIDTMINAIKRLLTHGVRAVRSTGCGVLDLCYVALGKMDVVYTGLTTEGWKPWDYCAGMVIVLESGAFIESLFDHDDDDGKEYRIINNDNGDKNPNYKSFDIYSKNMICSVDYDLLKECRNVVLDK